MWFDQFLTPIGLLTAVQSDCGLQELWFADAGFTPTSSWRRDESALQKTREQLLAYFAGELEAFDLQLAPQGTPFQLQVWKALREIPYATTWSYSQLAERLNNPKAVRAVGAANGRNPLPIIVPCHRVIGKSGRLVGFRGGLPIKEYLLTHEKMRSMGRRIAA